MVGECVQAHTLREGNKEEVSWRTLASVYLGIEGSILEGGRGKSERGRDEGYKFTQKRSTCMTAGGIRIYRAVSQYLRASVILEDTHEGHRG